MEMRSLVAAAHVDAYHFRYEESLAKDTRAIELAERVNLPDEEEHALFEMACVSQHLGDLEGARRNAAAALELSHRLGNRNRRTFAYLATTMVSLLEGDLPAARAFCIDGLEVSPSFPNLLCYGAIIEYTLGNFEEGEAYLDRLLQVMSSVAPGPISEYSFPAIGLPLRARITGAIDRLEVAAECANTVLASPSVHPANACVARTGLALLASQQGDVLGAREQYSALEEQTGTMLGSAMDSAIAADRVLALLSQTMGSLDQAAAHFEDALAFCHKAGYRPELAWTCSDYADTLLQRNEPGDREKATSLLDESLAISSELGMRPLMERVLSRRDILKA